MPKHDTHAHDKARDLLRPLVEKLGQAEVARRSGVPQPSISAWLAGRRPMTLKRCGYIAKACGKRLVVTIELR